MSNYYKDGWHDVKGTTLSFYVEGGELLRGTTGTGVDYKPVFPYRYDKELGCYVIVRPKAYRGVLNTVSWC